MTQVEGNNWKGEWFGGGTPFALDALTLSEDNNVVTITRQGGYGNGGCTYTGTVTGTEASGTYQCDWSDVNDWRGNFMSIPEPNS